MEAIRTILDMEQLDSIRNFQRPSLSFSPLFSTETCLILPMWTGNVNLENSESLYYAGTVMWAKEMPAVEGRNWIYWLKRLCASFREMLALSMENALSPFLLPTAAVSLNFVSCRWIPEVEKFQLSSCNSSGTDCLSCFCSFTGTLPSIGNNPFFTCYSPEQLENIVIKIWTLSHLKWPFLWSCFL